MSPDLFFLSIISLEQEGSNEETDDLSIQTQVRKAVNSFDFITWYDSLVSALWLRSFVISSIYSDHMAEGKARPDVRAQLLAGVRS